MRNFHLERQDVKLSDITFKKGENSIILSP